MLDPYSVYNANGRTRAASVGTARFVVRRAVFFAAGLSALYALHLVLLSVYSKISNPSQTHGLAKSLRLPMLSPHNPVPVPGEENRQIDLTDGFRDFANADACELHSLDLHVPIDPLCQSKQSVLHAMSYGGRPGFDRPFIPFGCDFRWFSSEEVCEILGRFSHIFVIGDSLQRMLVTALYILLRQDAALGGVAEWDFVPTKPPFFLNPVHSLDDCRCEHQFNRHECSHSPVASYREAVERSGKDLVPVCSTKYAGSLGPEFDLTFHEVQKYPIPQEELENLTRVVPSRRSGDDRAEIPKPPKPYAFVLHHTFWNNVNETATIGWVDQLITHLAERLPWLPQPWYYNAMKRGTKGWPRLFVTANAAGVLKNAAYLDKQNSNAIARFEAALGRHMDFRDVDLLGFYNMSVQTTSSDGTHANMRTNLAKAMMVLNWLDWVGREEGAAL